MTLSQGIEKVYHAIGAERRKEAFENTRFSGKSETITPPAVEPAKLTKPLISHDDCERLMKEFINTDDEDEMEFTFSEACEFVCEAYLQHGKYEWDAYASEILTGNARWYNQIQTCLQRMKTAGLLAYSKKRQCWIIL